MGTRNAAWGRRPTLNSHLGSPYPRCRGANTLPVTVSYSSAPGGEASFAPATVTFAIGEVNVYKSITLTGMDDTADDGNRAYTINFLTTSGDALFHSIAGPVGSFTNLDDDLLALGSTGWSVTEVEADQPFGHLLNITLNDADNGGNGSWKLQSYSVSVGQGQVEIGNTLRSVYYRPASDWYGPFEISYTIVNEWGNTSSSFALGTVTNVPDKPVAESDDIASPVVEDTPLVAFFALNNDHDADNWPVNKPANDGLTVANIGQVKGGAATISESGTAVHFIPAENFNGEAWIRYKVKDPQGNVSDDWATISFQVIPQNDKPKANKGGAGLQTDEDTPVAIDFDDDDEDPEVEQLLTYALVTPPSFGTVDFETMTYTPFPDYCDAMGDYFSYTVTDDETAGDNGPLTSDPAGVAVVINPVNDEPTADDASLTTDEDTPASLTLTGSDNDQYQTQTLTFAIVSGPGSGQITSFNPSTGDLTYLPDPNFNNEGDDYDTILFTVTDDTTAGGAALTSQTAAVTIRVNPINDLPDAVGDATLVGALIGNTPPPATLYVLQNDTDVDFEHEGDEHAVQSVTQGTYGSVTINGNNSVTYTPSGTFTLSDTFTYTLVDLGGATDTATVYVTYSWTGALMAQSPSTVATPSGVVFANDEEFSLALAPLVAEAEARWAATGIDTSALAAASIALADLKGDMLGLATSGTIVIDRDAAGFGWFVDATPGDNREFRRSREDEFVARRRSEAAGRMDLLTVIMHEMGHLLGVEHAEEGLMDEELAAGIRRNPDRSDVALMLAMDQSVNRRRNQFADDYFAELEIGGGW